MPTLGVVSQLKLDWAADFLAEKLSARPLTSVAVILLPNRPGEDTAKNQPGSASKAKALEQELAALRNADPKLLLAESMRSIGQNAEKVGQLNITTELMASLLQANQQSE